MEQLIQGPDGQSRCRWCAAAPEFLDYHDTEWGFPVSDDARLFDHVDTAEEAWAAVSEFYGLWK